jgi:hypothetical protein
MKHRHSRRWRPRKGSWYRQPSLAYSTFDSDLRRQEKQYINWLAESHGWFTTSVSCGRCDGSGQCYDPAEEMPKAAYALRRWRNRRKLEGKPLYLTEDDKIPCPTCGGSGMVPLEAPELDLKRAAAHVEDQRRYLWQRANDTCTALGEALCWRGFGAYISEAQRWVNYTETEECFNCRGNFRFPSGLCPICGGYGVYVAEKSKQVPYMSQHNNLYTDGQRFVYISSERMSKWYKESYSPIQIVVEPGRAPDHAEIEQILDAVLCEQAALPLAAWPAAQNAL